MIALLGHPLVGVDVERHDDIVHLQRELELADVDIGTGIPQRVLVLVLAVVRQTADDHRALLRMGILKIKIALYISNEVPKF